MNIVSYVWRKRFSGGISPLVIITASDVHWISSQTNDLAAQRLLLAAIFQQRVVNGDFYLGFERMKQLTSLAKDSLVKSIHILRDELGILAVVENYSYQPGLGKSKTNKYRLTKTPKRNGYDPVLLEVTAETWSKDLWFQLLQMVFTPTQIKRMHPFSHHRILSVPPIQHPPTQISN
ncbi:MAG: hypothetical protein ACO1OT_19015 [Heyndrickxia sp.]